MRAMVITSFGGPEVFEAREVPSPEPKPDEVRVKIHATSINPVDLKIRQSGQWAGIEPPTVIGYDVSGVIDKVGEAVHDLAVGEQVYYTPVIFGQQGSMSAAFQKNITVHYMFLQRARYKLKALKQLIEREQLKPVFDSALPLDQVAQAHRRLAEGGVKGKFVLEVV